MALSFNGLLWNQWEGTYLRSSEELAWIRGVSTECPNTAPSEPCKEIRNIPSESKKFQSVWFICVFLTLSRIGTLYQWRWTSWWSWGARLRWQWTALGSRLGFVPAASDTGPRQPQVLHRYTITCWTFWILTQTGVILSKHPLVSTLQGRTVMDEKVKALDTIYPAVLFNISLT